MLTNMFGINHSAVHTAMTVLNLFQLFSVCYTEVKCVFSLMWGRGHVMDGSLCSPTGQLTGRETEGSTERQFPGGNMRENRSIKGNCQMIENESYRYPTNTLRSPYLVILSNIFLIEVSVVTDQQQSDTWVWFCETLAEAG